MNFLTKEELDGLVVAWHKTKNQRAKDTIFNKILASVEAFINKEVHKYVGSRTTLIDDARQVGRWGVLKAIEKYEVGKDVKFITYAGWWIRAEIIRLLNKDNGPVFVPIHKQQAARREAKATNQELAMPKYIYWDRPKDIDPRTEPVPLMDRVVAEYQLWTISPIEKNSTHKLLKKLISKLPSKEMRAVMEAKLAGRDSKEISKELNLSRQRIFQLEEQAVKYMRKYTEMHEVMQ